MAAPPAMLILGTRESRIPPVGQGSKARTSWPTRDLT